MREYTCPACGILVGTATEDSGASFFHCGRRFPPILLPDSSEIAHGRLSASEKESRLTRLVRSMEDSRRSNDVIYSKAIHKARKQLEECRQVLDGHAALSAGRGPIKFSKPDRRVLVQAWFAMLCGHAQQNSYLPPERAAIDECVKYARKYNQVMPEWAG